MAYKHLSIEHREHITVIKFNRPEKMNTLNPGLMEEIDFLANQFNGDENSRVVIFTGNGDNFCAGVDLTDRKTPQKGKEVSRLMRLRNTRTGPKMIRSILEMNQITIAAINGFALGGGACIASACDFRIGADNCHVGFPEVNLAMNLSWVSLPLVVHLIGPSRAKQMVIGADRIDADTLIRWGFLDKCVAPGDLMKEAYKMGKLYASKPPIAAQMVKRSVNAISSALDHAIMHMDSDQFLYATSGEDFQEAVQAFFQKRSPVFKGN